jgi:hypothetical protein
MRICSFLPSATEIVYALGLGDQLYGVTRSCDYPAAALTKPVSSKNTPGTARASTTSTWRLCVPPPLI